MVAEKFTLAPCSMKRDDFTFCAARKDSGNSWRATSSRGERVPYRRIVEVDGRAGYYFVEAKRKALTRMTGCSKFQEGGKCSKETSNSRRAPGASGAAAGSSTERESRRMTW